MPQVEDLSHARSALPNTFTDIDAREVDFVSRFAKNWDSLREILGITRAIKKAPGTRLASYSASVTLESGNVNPGNVIPYSTATVVKTLEADLDIQKYAKAVTIEDVKNYGAEIAVEKTDEAFLNELQGNVLTAFYNFLKSGALTSVETSFQMALALAKARVLNKFGQMRKTATNVVGFCNVLDAYSYLGAANISTQTAFGIEYAKDFLGYSTLFLLSENEIPRGTVIATPVENIDLYYIDPSDSEFAKLGLVYRVDGETPLIGFHANGNYSTAVGESYALLGMTLWAEYLDGISVVTVEASGSLGSITGFSTAAAGDVKSKLTVPDPTVGGGTYWFKAKSSTAPADPAYLEVMDTTGWTKVVDEQVVDATNGHKYRVVELNGAGQAIASATGTVVAGT